MIGLQSSGEGYRLESLSRGVLGGRLLPYELTIQPAGHVKVTCVPESGDIAAYCLSGQCTLSRNGETEPFEEGDSLHISVEDAEITLQSGGEWETRILLMMDPREMI